jgi:hypothetical protein
MKDETHSSPCAFGPWVEEIFGRSQAEIRARRIVLRLEFDPEFVVARDAGLEAALVELCRLIITTVPDGCEIYFGSARSSAPVSRLGAGQWSARWQVIGEVEDAAMQTQLRPRPGGAERHSSSALAGRVRDRFAKTRWDFSLEVIDAGRELLARAYFR